MEWISPTLKHAIKRVFAKKNRLLPFHNSKHHIAQGFVGDALEYTTEVIDPNSPENLLLLKVNAYKNNIVRLRINEKNPVRPRYEVKDVLLEGIHSDMLEKQSGKDTTTFSFGNHSKLEITHNPFKIALFKDGKEVISANSFGLFNFEHSRKKVEVQQPEEVVSEGEDTKEEKKEENAEENASKSENWEESFKSHRDSRPFGPMSIGLDIAFSGSHVYGIPEHASNLALNPTKGEGVRSDPYRLYNLDVFEYELNLPMALYGSVPLMLAHGLEGSSSVLWLNPSETWVDVYKETEGKTLTHWISETGVLDIFFMLGPKPKDLLSQYASLTGTTELPPLFAIGYHQCRWNYRDEDDVASVDEAFDEYDIPYDVIWLDIEHTDEKKYFTWHRNYFKTPEKMLENIAGKRRKMVTIIDPHIKRDSNYYIHSEAESKSLYIKNVEGNDYEGWCWPGSSSWIDFTDPEKRKWWTDQFAYNAYKGSSEILFTWNDMNEPSVFNGPEVTMHKDAKHFGNLEHRDVHNMYGFYMHMATTQGLIQRNPGNNERPFVLSRAFFAGSQRYGAVWTGDNAAQWSHLEIAQPMLLTLSLAGISFSGADVGGFFGNPDAELFTRWYQAGAFHPFFRGHAHLDTRRREPWVYKEPTTSLVREAIRTRYSLLPLWYTLFFQNTLTGLPPMRPLFLEFPDDPNTFSLEGQFLVGDTLLVKPVVKSQQHQTDVYFPGNDLWYEFKGSAVIRGPKQVSIDTPIETIPVYQRGGTILPKLERIRRSSAPMQSDPYTLVIALDDQLEARGHLFVDDGHSFSFKRGAYSYTKFVFQNNKLSSGPEVPSGTMKIRNTLERVVILGYPQQPRQAQLTFEGKTENLLFEYNQQLKRLTIRKPDVPISQNWTIQMS